MAMTRQLAWHRTAGTLEHWLTPSNLWTSFHLPAVDSSLVAFHRSPCLFRSYSMCPSSISGFATMSYVGLCCNRDGCDELLDDGSQQISQALIATSASEEMQQYVSVPKTVSVSRAGANSEMKAEWRRGHGTTERVRFLTLGPRVFQSIAGDLEPSPGNGENKKYLKPPPSHI